MVRNSLIPVLLTIALAGLGGCGKKTQQPTSGMTLDQKLEQMMTGVTLVGRSSSLRSEKISGEEKYVIEGISKISGDTWLMRARFQYDGHDLPIPIPVTIKWAGDTPVITLTDLAVPGMGSYTARVVLYEGQYAGTWSGQKGAGGQVFGKIVRNR
jgi:hypothetical protein